VNKLRFQLFSIVVQGIFINFTQWSNKQFASCDRTTGALVPTT